MKKSSFRAQQTKRTHWFCLLDLNECEVLIGRNIPCWCSKDA
jgi:hypothetical protein